MKKLLLILVGGILLLGVFGIVLARRPKLVRNFLNRTGITSSLENTSQTSSNEQLIVKEEAINQPILEVAEGQVALERAGSMQTLAGDQTTELEVGDVVSTQADSLAVITYDESTKVRMGPQTTLEIVQAETQTSLTQTAGSIYVRFKKVLGVREEFTVETSTAVTTVRGTAFAHFFDKLTGETAVNVTDHQVEVLRKDPETGERLLNTRVTIAKDLGVNIASPSAKTRFLLKQKLIPARWARTGLRQQWIQFNRDQDQLETEPPSATESGRLRLRRLFRERYLKSLLTATSSAQPSPSPTLPILTSMPGTGFNQGLVKTDAGEHKLSCYGAAVGSVRVVTDSGNDNTCANECTVLPLADYATRNGGAAAMNGSYFCPADYPDCAGKTNSFDTLLFNSRSKNYLNSENNVYSTLPFLVINADGSPRFVSQTLQWGRDTSIQAGIAGNPLLMRDGQLQTGASLDTKQLTVKSNRGAFVQEGNNIYLCVASNATVPDSGKVYQTLGVDNAMNIDGGGSSALWVNGRYVYGPGRNIPNAIIFAR